jgi:multiple antibiotic resistance protein
MDIIPAELGFTQALVTVFVALFVLTHPFGNFAIFLGMTTHQSAAEQQRTALKTSVASFIITIVSMFMGAALLEFFGLNIPALQVAGGIIFVQLGMKMLSGEEETPSSDGEDSPPPSDPSVVPLALPMIIGPGAIVGLISFSNQSLGEGFGSAHLGAVIGAFLAIVVVYVVLRASPWLAQRLSKASIDLITQLTGIVVLGIGVLMGSAGLIELFPGWG